MSPWPTVALGDIAESVDYGVTASAKGQPTGPKFLRITDIQDGAVQWATVPWCDCDARSAASARLKTGDIVFARTGATTGKSFLIRECPADAVFASYLIRVRLLAAVEPRYISHYFQTTEYWTQITRSARGVAQPGVNATTLKSLTIPLPPLPEQRRIAAILDKADEVRTKRRAALEQLNSLTQSMFLEMFGDPSSNEGGWEVRAFGDVLAEPLRNGVSPSKSGKVQARVLTLSAVTGASFNETALKSATFTNEPPPDKRVNGKDFLICRGNGNLGLVGKGYFPLRSMPDVVFPDTIIAGRVDHSRVCPLFLETLWNSEAVRRQVETMARTTTGTLKVNQSMLEGIRLIVPPLASQRTFSQRTDIVRQLLTTNQRHLAKSDSLFGSLQHRAFSGGLCRE